MAISVSGRIVKAKPKSELKRVESNKYTRGLVHKYNHLRVQFADGADRHFLLTDKQVESGIQLAARKLSNTDPKLSWVREFWYDGLIDSKPEDVSKDIAANHLPKLAKRFNHIRVNIGNRDLHLLFPDGPIRSALNRAKKEESHLPKVSWLSDYFEDTKWENTVKAAPAIQPVAIA